MTAGENRPHEPWKMLSARPFGRRSRPHLSGVSGRWSEDAEKPDRSLARVDVLVLDAGGDQDNGPRRGPVEGITCFHAGGAIQDDEDFRVGS